LVTCLFATEGHDLKAALRAGASDDELRATVTGLWRRREDRYSELRADRLGLAEPSSTKGKIEMYHLGG
jgi:cyclic pyranopterin phosphate synthase